MVYKETLIAHYLNTAVASEYYKKEDWENWADNIIMNESNLDEWIYDVSIAKNKNELFAAIQPQLCQEYFEGDDLYSEADVIIGYYYLMYKERKMNLLELISRIYDEDDISVESSMCDTKEYREVGEMFFDNKLLISNFEWFNKIENLMRPLSEIALQQQKILNNFKKYY